MRLLCLTLLLSFNSLLAQTVLNQKLDFQSNGRTIGETLLALSKESGVNISFSDQFFQNKSLIQVQKRNSTLEEILQTVLANTNISYKTIRNRIILFRKKEVYFTINGYIKEESSGEPLIAASIYCPNLEKGTITNEYGFYSLTLPQGKVDLQFSYLGYQAQNLSFDLNGSLQQNVSLEPSLTLAEVLVVADSGVLVNQVRHQSAINLSPALQKIAPSLGGQEDIIRTAQLLPGIQSGVDGMGGTQVRGGDNGHNLMLLDGVPVYIPFHLLGALSIYNSSTVRSAKILKGSFPAQYGGRLSSVFDIRTREGNLEEWTGEASANLISTNLLLEGPLKKNKGALLLAGRYTPYDFLLKPTLQRTFFNEDQEFLNFGFYDFNAKLNYTFSDKDRVFLSYYAGRDNFEGFESFDEIDFFGQFEFDLGWSNQVTALRWNHQWNDKTFSNLTLTHSLYTFEYNSLTEIYEDVVEEAFIDELYYYSNISNNEDLALKLDIDYLPNPEHSIRFGAGINRRLFQPEISFFDKEAAFLLELDTFNVDAFEPFIDFDEYSAYESFVYFEDLIKPNPKLEINLGLRLSNFFSEDANYTRLEPRAALSYQASEILELKTSFSRMVQYLHLISNAAIRLPNDIWLPSTNYIKPQEAWQGEIGVQLNLSNQFNFSIEGYYKWMDNLYAFSDDDFLDANPAEDIEMELTRGSGTTYGIEFFLQRQDSKTGGWVSYALAWSDRQFENHNEGYVYPFAFDQRHQFKCLFYHYLHPRLSLSLNFLYNSAAPQLVVVNEGDDPNNAYSFDPNEPGEKNLARSFPYHRLDFNLAYELPGQKVNHHFKLGIYNLYNQRNVSFYHPFFREDGELESINPVYSMPLLPTFSYSLKL